MTLLQAKPAMADDRVPAEIRAAHQLRVLVAVHESAYGT